MFDKPPREKEWISWSYVFFWTLVIFLTIPVARHIQGHIEAMWGREAFTVIALGAIIIGSIRAVTYLSREGIKSIGNYTWLLLTTAIFIGYTFHLSKAPEEALHFVEYGVLGLLIFRALSHKIRDYSIYFSASVIGALIGTLDETVQWLIPQRYWDYRDIWLNFLAVSLIQVSIAKGLKPSIINESPSPKSLRLLSRLAIVLLLLITTSLINTPARVAWYAERIQPLEFLKYNPSTMNEYGWLYVDSEIGKFRSRFAPETLRQLDAEHSEVFARTLDQYRDNRKYKEFLQIFTPSTHPFLHEARVHLFRRDRYLRKAQRPKEDEKLVREYLDVVYRENRIMEKYYTQTLSRSSYKLAPETLTLLRRSSQQDVNYDSPVSDHLVTVLSEWQLILGLLSVIFGLTLVNRYVIK